MKIYKRKTKTKTLWHYECDCGTVYTHDDTVREYFSRAMGKYSCQPDTHEMGCPFCGKTWDGERAKIQNLPLPSEKSRHHRGWVRPKHVPRTIVQPDRSHGFTIQPQINWDRLREWIVSQYGVPCPVPPKTFFEKN